MADRSRVVESRAPAWVVVATLVHAAAIAALLLMPIRRHDSATGPSPAESTELAITLEGDPGVAQAPSAPPPGAAAEPDRPAERVASRAATAGASRAMGASSSEPAAAPGNGEPPPAGAPSPPGSGGVVPIPFTAAELGLGGIGAQNPFLPRAEEKVPTSGPDAPAARAMRGTGMAHDRELGLGPEGPVVKALADATSSSVAPLRGRAVFIVRSGGDGLVLGIDVIDSEGGTGWADAGRIALESLRGKKLVVPRGANGMNMRIEVRSDMKLPNGQDAPFAVRSGENKAPELTIPDPSNFGAKPRRVVHSRVVSTELL